MKQLMPIGTVVLLKEGEKRLMIYGIMQIHGEDGQQYDYVACLYPEGHIGEDHTYLFNHEDIEKVDFVGFVDVEFQAFRDALAKEVGNEEVVGDKETGENEQR